MDCRQMMVGAITTLNSSLSGNQVSQRYMEFLVHLTTRDFKTVELRRTPQVNESVCVQNFHAPDIRLSECVAVVARSY